MIWRQEIVPSRLILNEMNDLPLHQIAEIARAHGAATVKIFGSRARGTERPDSDLDLLIKTREGTSLFDLMRMEIALEKLLGIEVEVVTESSLRPELKDEVLSEAQEIAA